MKLDILFICDVILVCNLFLFMVDIIKLIMYFNIEFK